MLVIAPHPDDETLIAGGVIRDATSRHVPVDVVVVTNGDYTCERDGYARQAETVAAMAALGLPESQVHFLGYPDGHLVELGASELLPLPRRGPDGRCSEGNTTYANRGFGGTDEHTRREGKPGTYRAEHLEADLASVLSLTRPTDVFVTHPIDGHPDHKMAYTYLRRALERSAIALPRVHRAVVHAGACWPNGNASHEPCPDVRLRSNEPLPPLPEPMSEYRAAETYPLPSAARRDKYAALMRYRSQLGQEPTRDWLVSFVRSEEAFYPENLSAEGGRVSRIPETPEPMPSFAFRFDVAPGVRVTFIAGSPGDTYELTATVGPSKLSLARARRTTQPPSPLGEWRLADGATGEAEIRFTQFTSDGGATELELRQASHFLGIAVDPVGFIPERAQIFTESQAHPSKK